MIFGKQNFSDLTSTINNAVFRYCAFITDAIAFLSIAAAIFFFVVKPVDILKKRPGPGEEVVSDEERRHQELLAALQTSGR